MGGYSLTHKSYTRGDNATMQTTFVQPQKSVHLSKKSHAALVSVGFDRPEIEQDRFCRRLISVSTSFFTNVVICAYVIMRIVLHLRFVNNELVLRKPHSVIHYPVQTNAYLKTTTKILPFVYCACKLKFKSKNT